MPTTTSAPQFPGGSSNVNAKDLQQQRHMHHGDAHLMQILHNYLFHPLQLGTVGDIQILFVENQISYDFQ